MSKYIVLIFFITFFISCRNKETTNSLIQTKKQETSIESKFESQILDYRLEIGSFNSEYKFTKFGVKANDDQTHSFVLKLSPKTNNSTVESYTIGIRAFSYDLDKPLSFDVNPKVTKKDGNIYLIITQKLPDNIRYFDSILMFIYERDNWKEFGTIGKYIIRDVLFEDKEQ
jgi:uncharacterized protein YxeA